MVSILTNLIPVIMRAIFLFIIVVFRYKKKL